MVAATSAHRARPGPVLSAPARGRETPFVPTGGPLCSAAVVAAARLDASPITMPVLRSVAISGTIIDFDTFSHARMHTAAAFQTRSQRDRKKTQVR